jgi:endonuclease-3
VHNTAFGEPTIAVDTHIFRVANRTGIAPGANVVEVENRLEKFVADEFKHDCHHWLILHGRYTCTARAPKCAQCVILDLCEYRHKNLPVDRSIVAARSRKAAAPRKPVRRAPRTAR